MPHTQYNLHRKGCVGGADFDRNYVDYILAKCAILCLFFNLKSATIIQYTIKGRFMSR